jgi:carboxymethylenebutenolidase
MLAVVTFERDKLASERIYWYQASVLVQVGLLDPAGLPVAGVETAHKVLDPALPSNTRMPRWKQSEGNRSGESFSRVKGKSRNQKRDLPYS